jgi:hypothetical protein
MTREPVIVNDYGAHDLFRGIDSASLCSVAASTTNKVVVPASQARNRFLRFLKGLQIRAL